MQGNIRGSVKISLQIQHSVISLSSSITVTILTASMFIGLLSRVNPVIILYTGRDSLTKLHKCTATDLHAPTTSYSYNYELSFDTASNMVSRVTESPMKYLAVASVYCPTKRMGVTMNAGVHF